ncbi:MAG TPA: GyrI-like domain-containing protein [Candidatus Deferrimicrobiaceae bacterium]|nr:GyrI-like domain-containing protein [Candidatus Deferrimicrobiaceae bacterium]
MTTLEARGVRSSAEGGSTPVVFAPPQGLPRRGRVRFVDMPPRRCLAIEGQGPPGGAEFQGAVGALYSTIYALHFLLRDRGIGTRIGPLEALWERRDGSSAWLTGDFTTFDSEAWRWTALIEIPPEARDEDTASAMAVARRKHPSPVLSRLVVMTLREGHAVEALHVGPYATEPETLERMAAAATEAGVEPNGAHHEIYLGDPRRTAPDRLRTVLRQPVC